MITELSSTTADLIKTVLNISMLRHQVIADNIANHNTPGHVAKKVDFESILASELEQSGALKDDEKVSALLESVEAQISERENELGLVSSEKALDIEMTEMAKNTLKYEALIRGLSKLSSLKSMAISGGRR